MVARMPQETTGERLLARRYRLLAQVGHGGMGTVWQAHDEVLGRDVAVKEVVLPHGLTEDERAVQYKRTFREARTAARLGHPGVVTVYDVVEEDGRPWIVMELIHARSLDQVIRTEGPLEPRRAAEIGRQMLAALHAAHEAGVLHRDVKPSNVLIAAGDRAVLTDFGIATSQGDATLTQTGLVMGSPAYISPERARGKLAGPASDLWSLGITLYAMVEGKSPFERSEPMASLVAVITEEAVEPANGGPLAPVIEGLLRKEPADRLTAPEAGMMLDDIVRVKSADTERTRPVPVQEPPAPAEPAAEPAAPGEPGELDVDSTDTDPTGTKVQAVEAEAPVHDTPDTAGPPAAPAEPAASETSDRDFIWRPGPGTAPAPAAAPGPDAGTGTRAVVPAGRNGRLILIALIALLLLAGGLILANVLGGDEEPKGRTGAQEQGTTAPANPGGQGNPSGSPGNDSPAATPPRSTPSRAASPTTGAIPDGFRRHKDRTGFQIAVPDGWREERQNSSVFFRDPNGGRYIQVDQVANPSPSALKDWQVFERQTKADGRFPAYKRIRLEATGNEPPVPDTGNGDKSADWEFTWTAGGGRMHALDRGFVANGRGYGIFVVAPDSSWDKTYKEIYLPVFQSFKPADD
jgi:eukaryotic-like serine/threonine-protein kinase